jgi:hypothetical protein
MRTWQQKASIEEMVTEKKNEKEKNQKPKTKN